MNYRMVNKMETKGNPISKDATSRESNPAKCGHNYGKLDKNGTREATGPETGPIIPAFF